MVAACVLLPGQSGALHFTRKPVLTSTEWPPSRPGTPPLRVPGSHGVRDLRLGESEYPVTVTWLGALRLTTDPDSDQVTGSQHRHGGRLKVQSQPGQPHLGAQGQSTLAESTKE